MGRLEIDENSAVMRSDSRPVPDLYAARKVVGGVQACINRSGGNSLLDCVVFGRVTRGACARYVLGDSTKVISLAALAGGRSVEWSKSDMEVCPGTLGLSPTMCRVA